MGRGGHAEWGGALERGAGGVGGSFFALNVIIAASIGTSGVSA